MTDNLTQWPEAQHIAINAKTVIWYGESRRQIGHRMHLMTIQGVTSEVHPARVYVKTTMTEDRMVVELVDNHGAVLAEKSQVVLPSSQSENTELLDELTRLIKQADDPRAAAKAILDAGWEAPEPIDEDDYNE